MVLFPFCRRVGGGQRGCQPAKYMSIFTSMPLSGKHTCAGAKKSSDLPSTLCQPDVIVSLVYARGDGSTCVILDAFFFFQILLHCITLKTSCSWVCQDEIPTHLLDFKHWRSKMKRKLDFMGPWPMNSSEYNGTDLCEVCETALTRRGRGFNLCSRSHKSPSGGWKMSSNSTAVKSTRYARLRKKQHWK